MIYYHYKGSVYFHITKIFITYFLNNFTAIFNTIVPLNIRFELIANCIKLAGKSVFCRLFKVVKKM